MFILGFDIGGTKCAVITGQQAGDSIRILGRKSCHTDLKLPPEKMLEKLCGMAEGLCGDRRPNAVGISCGGPLDGQSGLILSPPNLPGWDRIPVTRILEKRWNVPARLQNDANACALAEWRFGAGKGCRHMVFLTFGTGLGAGLILNGRLYAGAGDMAGEVGHIRLAEDGPVGFGKAGSFEGFCSGGGLARLGTRIAESALADGLRPAYWKEGAPVTAKSIAAAAQAGDAAAMEVYRICARQLGRGLSILIDLLAPERIVIGSIFARSGDLMIPEMEKTIAAEALPQNAAACKIFPAALGEQLGDYAALCAALPEETKDSTLL